MLEPKRSGMSPVEAGLLVGGGIIVAAIAFGALHAIVGTIWFVIKVVIVVIAVTATFRFLTRRR